MDVEWTDQGLLDACRAGDPSAWREVCRRAAIAVRRTAFRFGGIPSEDFADIGQEVARHIAKQIGEVKNLPAFTKTVAHNKCVDWLRKKRPVLLDGSPRGDDDGDRSDGISDVPDPQPATSELERNEGVKVLRDAVRRAEPKCRRLFELLFWEACSYADIASRESIPQNQVGMVRSRCFDKLREYMRKQPGAMDALGALWPAR